ncbi:MAG: DUF2892 domain-containing protein [Candidatus Marinimicrobia bacterium]|nr:DUF2892 domain-containing protein [Candidatus Neomarinimicrobiota bacterium]
MRCNLGTADRMIRIITGAIIIGLGLYFDSWWGIIGLLPLLTGTFCWCALYVPLKINTNNNNT